MIFDKHCAPIARGILPLDTFDTPLLFVNCRATNRLIFFISIRRALFLGDATTRETPYIFLAR